MKRARILRLVLAWSLLGSGPCRAWAKDSVDPEELLDQALTSPSAPYAGHMTVTRWFGKKTKAEEVRAFWAAPNRYRWEFLAQDGSVERTVVSDGSSEELRLHRGRQVIRGDAGKSGSRLMSRDRERDLLFANYEASLAGSEPVLGRQAWMVDLSPRTHGKPHQRLWIDRQTKVILENKRFLPQGGLATFSRFTRFEPRESLPDDLFQMSPPGQKVLEEHGLEPDFLTLEAVGRAMGKGFHFPGALPGGFEFESGDRLKVQSRTAWHLRYTDGLVSLSLFQTDRPVRLGTESSSALSAPVSPASPWVSSSGRMLHWRSGSRYLTIIAEVSAELLSEIASRLGRTSN